MNRLPLAASVGALAAALAVLTVVGVNVGPMKLSVGEIVSFISGLTGMTDADENPMTRVVIVDLRMPRVVLSMLIGAILGLCGAVMQGFFRNPLADPGIIGVSAGAAVGAILAIAFTPVALAVWSVPLAACVGGLAATLLVYALAQSQGGVSTLILLLAGVVVTMFAGAVISFTSYFANDQVLRELTVWQMGSMVGANWTNVMLCGVALLVLASIFQSKALHLNALLLGEAEARHMGINVENLKVQLILLTACGVGISVASAGIIGFVGLMVPHAVRLMVGPDHRKLLPLSALFGAVVLLLADIVSRVVIQPAELPIGLVTALVGAPLFLVFLQQYKRVLH